MLLLQNILEVLPVSVFRLLLQNRRGVVLLQNILESQDRHGIIPVFTLCFHLRLFLLFGLSNVGPFKVVWEF